MPSIAIANNIFMYEYTPNNAQIRCMITIGLLYNFTKIKDAFDIQYQHNTMYYTRLIRFVM